MNTFTAIRTERNLMGQCEAEYEIQRIVADGKIVQETVREYRYDTDTGILAFENRAVEPERARRILAEADVAGALS